MKLTAQICSWEILHRRAAAEALWRAGGCAIQDDKVGIDLVFI